MLLGSCFRVLILTLVAERLLAEAAGSCGTLIQVWTPFGRRVEAVVSKVSIPRTRSQPERTLNSGQRTSRLNNVECRPYKIRVSPAPETHLPDIEQFVDLSETNMVHNLLIPSVTEDGSPLRVHGRVLGLPSIAKASRWIRFLHFTESTKSEGRGFGLDKRDAFEAEVPFAGKYLLLLYENDEVRYSAIYDVSPGAPLLVQFPR